MQVVRDITSGRCLGIIKALSKVGTRFSLLLLLVGCNNPIYNSLQDSATLNSLQNHKLYYLDEFKYLKTPKDVSEWINARVEGDPQDNPDDVKNPEEFLSSGKGSCLEYSLLFLNILYYSTGVEGRVVVVERDRRIEGGGIGNHAVIKIGSTYIEPQNGEEVVYTPLYSYSFNDVFSHP